MGCSDSEQIVDTSLIDSIVLNKNEDINRIYSSLIGIKDWQFPTDEPGKFQYNHMLNDEITRESVEWSESVVNSIVDINILRSFKDYLSTSSLAYGEHIAIFKCYQLYSELNFDEIDQILTRNSDLSSLSQELREQLTVTASNVKNKNQLMKNEGLYNLTIDDGIMDSIDGFYNIIQSDYELYTGMQSILNSIKDDKEYTKNDVEKAINSTVKLLEKYSKTVKTDLSQLEMLEILSTNTPFEKPLKYTSDVVKMFADVVDKESNKRIATQFLFKFIMGDAVSNEKPIDITDLSDYIAGNGEYYNFVSTTIVENYQNAAFWGNMANANVEYDQDGTDGSYVRDILKYAEELNNFFGSLL